MSVFFLALDSLNGWLVMPSELAGADRHDDLTHRDEAGSRLMYLPDRLWHSGYTWSNGYSRSNCEPSVDAEKPGGPDRRRIRSQTFIRVAWVGKDPVVVIVRKAPHLLGRV